MSSFKDDSDSSSKTSSIKQNPITLDGNLLSVKRNLSRRLRSHPCQTERVRRKHDFSRLIYGRISPNKISFEPKTSRSRGIRFCSGQTGFCFAKTNICFSRTQFCSSKTKPVRYQRSFVYRKQSFVSGKQSRFEAPAVLFETDGVVFALNNIRFPGSRFCLAQTKCRLFQTRFFQPKADRPFPRVFFVKCEEDF